MAQSAAFSAATGGTSPTAVSETIAAVVMIVALLMVAWISYGLYVSWQRGRLSPGDLSSCLIRGAILLAVLSIYVR